MTAGIIVGQAHTKQDQEQSAIWITNLTGPKKKKRSIQYRERTEVQESHRSKQSENESQYFSMISSLW